MTRPKHRRCRRAPMAARGIDGAERLPSYVSNVTAYTHEPKRTTYAANETVAAARLCVDAACSARALGSLGEGCGDGCQGTVPDVALDGPPADRRCDAGLRHGPTAASLSGTTTSLLVIGSVQSWLSAWSVMGVVCADVGHRAEFFFCESG